MKDNLKQYFEILEIEPTDSLDTIKQAYKDLVNVWNPDRFVHDADLHQKAVEKINRINKAYDFFCEILKSNNIDTFIKDHDEKSENQNITANKVEKWYENLGIIIVIVFLVFMILGVAIVKLQDNNINNSSLKTDNNTQKINIPLQKSTESLPQKTIDLPLQTAADYYNRGDSYFKSKDYQQAIKDYNKAIELNPKYAKAYYSRGCAYSILGNVQQAISDYKIAAALGDKYTQEILTKNGISW
ncbi:MAG: tetratricopeptide repeat protein [Nitrospirae bacterium]|nr:tetratricopeptide repeat protein [Nitrospirota bacterium]